MNSIINIFLKEYQQIKYYPMKNFAFLSCIIFALTASAQVKTLEPGDNAPGFNLKNVDGQMVSPEHYPGAKGFIVVFTANTCPFAIAYEDRLIALGKKYNSKGYPVIAINPNPPDLSSDDSFEKMQDKAKTKGFSFPYLFDEGQKVTNQYGAKVTPHIFLLKKEGSQLKVVYTGAIDNDTQNVNPDKTLYVEDAIAALEAGKEIQVLTTKAIGCTVKRSGSDGNENEMQMALHAQRKSIAVDQAILDSYTGSYEFRPGFEFIVTSKEGRIFTQPTGQPIIEVFAESQEVFFPKLFPATLTFNKDTQGNIKSLTLEQGGKKMEAPKIK